MKDNFIINEDSNIQSLLTNNKLKYKNSLNNIQTIFKMCTDYFKKQSIFTKDSDFFSNKLENTICLEGELFAGKTTFINDLIKYANVNTSIKVIKINLYDYSLSSEPLYKLATDLIYQIKNTKLEYLDFKKKENTLLDIISAFKNFLLDDNFYDASTQINTIFGDRMILTDKINTLLNYLDSYINQDRVLVLIDNLENITSRSDYYFFSFFTNFLFKIRKFFFIATIDKNMAYLSNNKFIKCLPLKNNFYRTINLKLITTIDETLNNYINNSENSFVKIILNKLDLNAGIISMCVSSLKNFQLLNNIKLKEIDDDINILINGLIFYLFYLKMVENQKYEYIIKNINHIINDNDLILKMLTNFKHNDLNLPIWIYNIFFFDFLIFHLHEKDNLTQQFEENIQIGLKDKNNLIFFKAFQCLIKCNNFTFDNFTELHVKKILFLLLQTNFY